MAIPLPTIGPISGEISIAPMITAGELSSRPMVAMPPRDDDHEAEIEGKIGVLFDLIENRAVIDLADQRPPPAPPCTRPQP
jgi:hypothetical protein